MDITFDNIECAVCVFYGTINGDRNEAHKWLTNVQRRKEAWDFVWELIHPSKRIEVQFFAASTLHTKLLKDWNELPTDSRDTLGERIHNTVLLFLNGPSVILQRLCICMATLFLQKDPENIIDILNNYALPQYNKVLLEILKQICEEFNTMIMAIERYNSLKTSLIKCSPLVISNIRNCLKSEYEVQMIDESNAIVISSAAACAESWLALCSNSNEITNYTFSLIEVLISIVERIYNESDGSPVMGAHLEACISSLQAIQVSCTTRGQQLALHILSKLLPVTIKIIQNDNIPNSPNEELLISLYTCLVEIAETQTGIIADSLGATTRVSGFVEENGSLLKTLVQVFLTCQSAPGFYPIHEEHSNLTFGFWYSLQEEIVTVSNDVKEVYTFLMKILLEKLKQPTSIEPEQIEMLKRYTVQVDETIMCCHSVIGEQCWDIIALHNDTESALLATLALSEAAPHGVAIQSLCNLIMLASMTQSNTALRCLRDYSQWLASLSNVEKLIDTALWSALNAVTRGQVAGGAALRRLCSDCESASTRTVETLVRGAIEAPRDVRDDLLYSAAAALRVSSPEQITVLLPQLIQLITSDIKKDIPNAVCKCKGCEGAIEILNGANSTEITKQILLMLQNDLFHFASKHTESFFQFIKQIVVILMDECKDILENLTDLTLTALNIECCPSGVDVVRLMCLMFYDDKKNVVETLLCNCVDKCLSICQSEFEPDVAEALLLLVNSIGKKRPIMIQLIERNLSDVIVLACICLSKCDICRVAACCLTVLSTLVQDTVRVNISILMQHFIHALCGGLPRNQVDPLGEVLVVLKQIGTSFEVKLLLTEALAPLAHLKDTEKFIDAVVKGRSNKRRMVEQVREYTLVCRGLVKP